MTTHPPRTPATLSRERTDDRGTFGTLTLPGLRLRTGELPWRENEFGFSCIPPGSYHCMTRMTENRGDHFQVLGVPQRSEVLIHTGTWCGDVAMDYRSDVRGCILAGLSVAEVAGQEAIVDSSRGMLQLLRAAPNGLVLWVVDNTPGGQAGADWRP